MQKSSQSDPRFLTWEKLPITDLAKKENYTVTLFKDYVIIFGGREPVKNAGTKDPSSSRAALVNLQTNRWQELKLTDSDVGTRWGHTACLYKDNQIIIFGGIEEKEDGGISYCKEEVGIISLDNIESSSLGWQAFKVKGTALQRAFHTSHIYENHMYTFGGDSGTYKTPSNQLWKLDLDVKEWIKCPTWGNEPDPRSGHCSVLIKDKIYISGEAGKKYSNELFVIDLVKYKWKQVGYAMETIRRVAATCIQDVGNRLYIFGKDVFGKFVSNMLTIYDADDDKWDNIDLNGESPSKRSDYQSVYYQGQILIFGDKTDSTIYSLSLENRDNKDKKDNSSQLLEEKADYDIRFVVQGQEIEAHKNILVAKCRYFQNMFASGMLESHSSSIEIPDIQPATFKAFLDFIYNKRVNLDCNLAICLLEMTDKYCVPELKSICEDFLEYNLTLDNFVSIAKAAEKFDAPKLKKTVVEYVIKCRDLIEQKDPHLLNIINMLEKK